MTAGFNGRRVAITGGAGSIGAAVGTMLLERGAAQVYALDLKASDEVPKGAEFLATDLTSEESVAAAVREIYAAGDGPVDLVNCAGIVEDDVAAEDMPMSLYDAVMGVNLRGYFLTCRDFGRELLGRGGGAIVNVASMSGNAVVNYPQKQSVYNTSKAGVSALTRSLAVEWGPRGVRVNAVSPGYVDTPLNALKQHMHERWLADTPLKRFGDLSEIAGAVCYLLSSEAGFCIGTELLIDGGFSLR
ncbi:SDR family NAD(P)-dependent oxidoreductase [Streptomyces sp. MMS24-I2-30]|uniref:SDR family NAD(P)-dependent oxidoreductase n=1 Tax=Streptomyces sp. MMS24-I2-30 TaxID=3351564 RepID=UPI003896DCCA